MTHPSPGVSSAADWVVPSGCTHLPHGLLQLLQADLLGLPQQRALVHLQHGHAVLAELHHHHVGLHRPDGLQGQPSPWAPPPARPQGSPSMTQRLWQQLSSLSN